MNLELAAGISTGLLVWTGFSWVEHRSVTRKLRQALKIEDAKNRSSCVRALLFSLIGLTAQRRWKNLTEIPDFFDLLALGLSAGLTLERAWATSLPYLPLTPLTKELKNFERALALGRSHREAFQELSARLDDARFSMVFTLIEHAFARGGALQEILQEQARALRQLRFLTLERRAQAIGIRLLFPIFLFIFPTVFLILFAPLVIRAAHGFPLF